MPQYHAFCIEGVHPIELPPFVYFLLFSHPANRLQKVSQHGELRIRIAQLCFNGSVCNFIRCVDGVAISFNDGYDKRDSLFFRVRVIPYKEYR